tara:strand:+ start:1255 stop:1482 length:228 start_codon:yes stop_codon:yes gene_type:complete
MRLPRKLKKQIKGAVIKYDHTHLPDGFIMKDIIQTFKKTGILYYSSKKYTGEGVEIDAKYKNKGVKFVDVLGNTH